MGFSKDNGYVPTTISAIMASVMANVNTQFGTTYTVDTFIGTNFYKYFYALAQRLQESEVATSEIFLKLQDYFNITNERISRPVVTNPGLIEIFKTAGYTASVKKTIDADAGKCYICVDVDDGADDYAAQKLILCGIVRDSVVAGVVSQGDQAESIVLSNGQSFDFKYALPNKINIALKLTTTLSENNQFAIATPEAQKLTLLANIAAKYQLGRNFEPERYFTVVDAPWAATVLLQWSDDAGANWHSTVYDADFDDLFVMPLEDVSLVES